MLEQALAEVTNRNETFKNSMEKAWADNQRLKDKLRAHGIADGDEDEGSADGESE